MATLAQTQQIGLFPSGMEQVEAKIINRVITEALSRNLLISVHDGEEWVLRRSGDRETIQRAVAWTDETRFRMVKTDMIFFGSVQFIHGNDVDVIHDYTDNESMADLMKPVMLTVDRLAEVEA